MKRILPLTTLLFSLCSLAYSQTIYQQNIEWRKNQNEEFRNPEQSPLTEEDRKKFDSISFFPIDEAYHVKALVTLTPDSVPFKMKTSTDRLPDYRQWGMAQFSLEGKQFSIPVYQNLGLMNRPGLEDYLFIPFTDLTNGVSTYGGGRYVEARIPENDTFIIDFNKAYNPYCAYNDRYSCPIPPAANHLNVEIKAGELAFHSEYKEKKSKRKKKKKSTE